MWYAIEGHDAEGTLPKRLAVRQQHLARLLRRHFIQRLGISFGQTVDKTLDFGYEMR